MKLKLEQAFFGNDRMGYRLLGISSAKFAETVESLCNAIGTPDGFSELKPFLISVPQNEMLFMICCQQGALDASGRKTLFFHALIGNRAEADSMGVNAFSLHAAGCFANTMKNPSEAIAITSPLYNAPTKNSPFAWDGGSMAIISKKPEDALLRDILGSQANAVAWSGFSFRSLDDFKLYVLSEFVLRPADRKCFSPEGRPIAGGSARTTIDQRQEKATTCTVEPSRSRPNWLLPISLVCNAVLLACLLFYKPAPTASSHPAQEPVKQPEIIVEEPKPPLSKPPLPIITRESVLAELQKKFNKDYELKDVEAEVKKHSGISKYFFDKEEYPGEFALMEKIKANIDFINNEILTTQTQGK